MRIATALVLCLLSCGWGKAIEREVAECRVKAGLLSQAFCSGSTDASARSQCTAAAAIVLLEHCLTHQDDDDFWD